MKKLFLGALLTLVVSSPLFALTWQQALSLAEKNNNELNSARKQLESTEWSYNKSFSTFLPQLSASASLSNSQSGTAGATSQSYSYGLNASQALFRGMSGIYGIQSAYSNLEYQRASLRATTANVYYELRSAFLNVLVAQENVRLLEQILKQRQDNASLIELRYDSGKEDKGNLMSTRADEAQAKYDLSSAKRDLKLAKLKLSQLLGQSVADVKEDITVSSPTLSDYDELIKTTPSYIQAVKQIESAELAYKATISGFLPSISLSGSYRKSGSDWPPEGESKSWSLSLSYPLFPGGSNFADRAIYSAKLDQAREDFAGSEKDIRYSLEEAFENFNDSLEGLKVAEISLAAAGERSKISRVKYLNGLTNYDEWDRIESSFIQQQKSLLNNKKSALLAEASWYKSYGGYVK